ncbi:MAG: aldo/keto reductase, partial [Anaerotignum sp.]|nr:aldo/keto reductase [Anaerotignum sp.]
IQVEAWSPLGRAALLNDPLVVELAKKYGKTPAQICLRFCLQSNILPLPKASSPERMKENLDIFDFDLSLEDVFRLTTMPETGWSGQHPEHF